MDNELKKAVKALLDHREEYDVRAAFIDDGCNPTELDALLKAARKALNPTQYELQRQMRETHEILSINSIHDRTYVCRVREWPPTSTPYGWRLQVLASFEVLYSLRQNRMCEFKVGDYTFRGLEALSYDASLAVDPEIGKYDPIPAELYFQHCDGPPDLGTSCPMYTLDKEDDPCAGNL